MHGKFNALMVTQRVGVGVVPYLNGAHPRGARTSEARVCVCVRCAVGLAQVLVYVGGGGGGR